MFGLDPLIISISEENRLSPVAEKSIAFLNYLTLKGRYIYTILKVLWRKTYYIFQSVSRQTAHEVLPFGFL